MQKIYEKLQNGEATVKDLLKATDAECDASGTISKAEYNNLTRRLG